MLYLAAPMSMYHSREYRLALVEARAQAGDVFDVRTAYPSNADWLARWPVERDRYDSCWIVSTPGGWIGRACHTEAVDLAELGRPVYWWNGRTDRFRYSAPSGNWKRWVRLTRDV